MPTAISADASKPGSVDIHWNKTTGQVLLFYSDELRAVERFPTVQPVRLEGGAGVATLRALLACEDYYFRLQRVDHGHKSPLSRVVDFWTIKDLRAPPKHVRVESFVAKDGFASLRVTWDAACLDHDLNAVGYEVLVTELAARRSEAFVVNTTQGPAVTLTLTHFKRGHEYDVRVRTNLPQARLSEPFLPGGATFVASPFAEPSEFKAELSADEQHVQLSWVTTPDVPNGDYAFEVWSRDMARNARKSASQRFRLAATVRRRPDSNRTLALLPVATATAERPVREFKVRLVVPHHAALGRFTQIEDVVLPEAASSSSAAGPSMVAVIASTVLVGVALVLAVLVACFVRRGRRLRRRFSAFANSHYDSHTGTTTLDLDGEEDQPMITGFSDDEPLVIA